MSDEDNNFGGSLVLDFRKWWRHVQPRKSLQSSKLLELVASVQKVRLNKLQSFFHSHVSSESKYEKQA